MAFVDLLVFLFVVFSLTYFAAPRWVWMPVLGLLLGFFFWTKQLPVVILIIVGLFYLLAVLFAGVSTLRIRYVTGPLIRFLQKRMPIISETEKIAIEAGDVWWEKELFCGRPRWKKLLAMPAPSLTLEEKIFLDQQVEILCGMLNDWEITHELKDLPANVWHYLKQEKFFGLIIPKNYGGLGFSALAHSSIVVKIASRSASAAVSMMVPNSLGPAELLLHYGTEEQKKYYLPKLASGEEIPCFALTAAEAGSDASSLTDSGVVCRGVHEGKEIIGIKLNWNKRYITLAPIATVLGLAIRLTDPDKLLSNDVSLGITLCLVPTNHPGVQMGERHLPLNLAFMNGPTIGHDVFIPLEWVIGGLKQIGQGWKMLMESLSVGRSISLPALSTACGQMIYRVTGAYARLRRQFNLPLSAFEGVCEALARIAGSTYLLEASRLLTVTAVDQKISPAIASAIAKYNMTELARAMVNDAMDIHAGHGIQMGPNNLIAPFYFAAPMNITVEGANILTRNLIIFGQGAIRCHPYLLKEVEQFAATDSSLKIKKLDRLLLSHAGYFISQTLRNVISGLTGGRLLAAPERGFVAYYYRQLTRMSIALSWLSDITLLLLGGELKKRERLSARLGDMLSQLYLASAVLKYFKDQGQPEIDVDYVKWSLEKTLAHIQIACDQLLRNFPKPWLGRLLRYIIFPFGQAYPGPSDQLDQKIVLSMTDSFALRDRLTHLIYRDSKMNDPLNRLDNALLQLNAIEPLLKKLQNAIRQKKIPSSLLFAEQLRLSKENDILSVDEIASLRDFDHLYQDVIRVDEFSFDLNSVLTKEKSEWKEIVI